MIKVLDSNKSNFQRNFKKLILERRAPDKKTYNIVNKIIKDVQKRGNKALIYYEKKFQNNSIIIPSKTSDLSNNFSIEGRKSS